MLLFLILGVLLVFPAGAGAQDLSAPSSSRPAAALSPSLLDTAATDAPIVEIAPACIPASYSGSGIKIAWSDPTVNTVQIGTAADFANFVFDALVPTGTLSTTAPDGFYFFSYQLTLRPNTTYYVRTGNVTSYSAAASFRVSACDPPPQLPTLAVGSSCLRSATSSDVATVAWGEGNVASVEVGLDPSFSNYVFTKSVSPGSTSTALPTGFDFFSNPLSVAPATTYYVRTFNGSYSPAASFSIPVCPPPAKPSTNIPTCIQPGTSDPLVTIGWTDPDTTRVEITATSDFTGYTYRKPVTAGTSSTTAPNGFFFFSGELALDPNTTYYVRTLTGGVYSPVTTFSIPSCNATPTPPTITTPGCIDYAYSGSGIQLAWTDSHVVSVSLSSNRAFTGAYTKPVVTGSLATTAPAGFLYFSTALTLDPNVAYFARVYNGSYSTSGSFTVPNCPRPPPPSTVPNPKSGAKKVMPVGDSITQGTTVYNSYRRPLWFKLANAGFSVDFVGSMNQNFDFSGATHLGLPPNPDFDLDHDGHWGWTAEQLPDDVYAWANATKPDYALVDVGTNDMASGRSVDSTIADLGGVVDELRRANTKITVLLAQLTPSTEPKRNAGVTQLNAAIPALVAQKSSAASPVILVDQNSGFDPVADTWDGLHPNASGEEKMATRWFDALKGPLSQQPVTLNATADTYVANGSSGTNYGTATQLTVDGSPTKRAYLKFDLSALKGKTLIAAKLQIKATSSPSAGSASTQTVKLVSTTSWSESAMTYRNAPALSTSLGSVSKTTPNATYQIPLSLPSLQSRVGGLVSLGIDSPGSDELYFSSRETSNKPQLVLTFK